MNAEVIASATGGSCNPEVVGWLARNGKAGETAPLFISLFFDEL